MAASVCRLTIRPQPPDQEGEDGHRPEHPGLLHDDARDEGQRDAVHRQYVARGAEAAGWIRLATAQDLAWALATSPAFLFNR